MKSLGKGFLSLLVMNFFAGCVLVPADLPLGYVLESQVYLQARVQRPSAPPPPPQGQIFQSQDPSANDRLSRVESRVDDHERRLKNLEAWRLQVAAALRKLPRPPHRRAKAKGHAKDQGQGQIQEAMNKIEILHGVRNVTLWDLEWEGDQLSSESLEKVKALEEVLKTRQEIPVVIVGFDDCKSCAKSRRQGQVLVRQLGLSDQLVELQPAKSPGEGTRTVIFTVLPRQ